MSCLGMFWIFILSSVSIMSCSSSGGLQYMSCELLILVSILSCENKDLIDC